MKVPQIFCIKECFHTGFESSKKAFQSIYTTVVRQANELAYAIEKERYNKLKNAK